MLRPFTIIGTLIATTLLCTSVYAQTASASRIPQPSPSAQDQSPTNPQAQKAQTELDLERKIQNLEQQVSTLTTVMIVGGSILAAFLTLGTAGSIFSLWNFERRASESHQLAIRGESASQSRAAEVHKGFLEGSKTTLDLVNATLTLAKEASERAAHFLEEKARDVLDSLDTEAKALLATVPRGEDRALVADQRRRSSLMSLAQKVSAFEINRLILPRDIKLTPPCMFIRGMEHHLRQQFEDALTYWKQVALAEGAETSLRSLAWYWIGYEYNNLGDFPQAVSSFQQALNYSEGSRSYELQRILIESRFFGKEEPQDLVISLEMLLKQIEGEPQSDELGKRYQRICGTLGNVLHVMGETSRRAGKVDEANSHFQRAANYFSEASERDRWARFGLAEALFCGGQVEEARRMFEESVLLDAQKEGIDRMEPRTKVLARLTEMICYIRVPRLRDQLGHMRSQVLESLGDVDERLTVYSQVQRRNVFREDFLADLTLLETQESA